MYVNGQWSHLKLYTYILWFYQHTILCYKPKPSNASWSYHAFFHPCFHHGIYSSVTEANLSVIAWISSSYYKISITLVRNDVTWHIPSSQPLPRHRLVAQISCFEAAIEAHPWLLEPCSSSGLVQLPFGLHRGIPSLPSSSILSSR